MIAVTTRRTNTEPQKALIVRLPASVKYDAIRKAEALGLSLNLVIETKLVQWLAESSTPQVLGSHFANGSLSVDYSNTLQSRADYRTAIDKLAGE